MYADQVESARRGKPAGWNTEATHAGRRFERRPETEKRSERKSEKDSADCPSPDSLRIGQIG